MTLVISDGIDTATQKLPTLRTFVYYFLFYIDFSHSFTVCDQ